MIFTSVWGREGSEAIRVACYSGQEATWGVKDPL